jgi:chromosome segregation ATPase
MISKNVKIGVAGLVTVVAAFVGGSTMADNNWIGSGALSNVRASIDVLVGKNKDLSNKYNQANQELSSSKSSVTSLNAQITSLQSQLTAKQNELNTAVSQANTTRQAEIQSKIAEINQKITEGNQKVAEKQAEVDAKQKEIDSLTTQLAAANSNNEELQKALKDAQNTEKYASDAANSASN